MCVIDGVANALVRLDGSVATAELFYQVADRIVANRADQMGYGITVLPPAAMPIESAKVLIHEIEEVIDEPLPRVWLKQYSWWSAPSLAVCFALIVAFLVTPWR